MISATQELIRNRLGAEGFYFAKVEPVPETDDAHRIVNLTLFVNPGSRTYVRHINFTGTTRSNDETLRRELRQLEGAWMSNIAVERSKQRLQRLPFVETVDMTTDPVAGAPDLVDVNFAVKERPSASVGGGIGYSAAQKFVLNANFSDSDFFGGGDQVTLAVDSGAYNKQYSLSQTDPYRTVDGLSRTLSLSYRDSTQFVSASSAFNSSSLELGIGYGYPISEFQGINAGINVQSINLLTFAASSAQQAVQWVQDNGRSYRREAVTSYLEPDGSTITNSTALIGSRFNLYELTAGWAYDSRNRGLFADRGMRSALSISVVPPGGDVRYWIGSYSFTGYWGLWRTFTLAESLQLAYGRGIVRHHRPAALQAFLRRRPGHHPRLHRGHARSGRQQRQPVWRQHAGRFAHRAAAAGAAEVADQRACEPVLRPGQRVLERRHQVSRRRPADPGELRVQL